MPSWDKRDRALWAFSMAHRFIYEFGIRWLPVNPEDVIAQRPNWHLKYVDQVAEETGETVEHILNHVMRSQDGLSMYDVKKDAYDIIINATDEIPPGRVLWTKMHEVGHIYLGHLKEYEVTELRRDELGAELYDRLEFEADMFAGEVLASKWLMRQIDIVSEQDIVDICGLTDTAALSRYKRATEDYQYKPANVTFTLHQFQEYLREITVCTDRSEIDLGRFAQVNPPKVPFKKPMAPPLRRPGICPYCAGQHSDGAKFCPHCGSPLSKLSVRLPGHYCWNRQAADATFCEMCGNPVLRIRQGLCFEECEI